MHFICLTAHWVNKVASAKGFEGVIQGEETQTGQTSLNQVFKKGPSEEATLKTRGGGYARPERCRDSAHVRIVASKCCLQRTGGELIVQATWFLQQLFNVAVEMSTEQKGPQQPHTHG